MATYRKAGDILNLELQLGDGAKFPTTRVFAQIDELDATPIVAIFELTKVADGSYTDDIQVMPTNSAIKVTYFIRKTNGTSPETKYNPYYLTELFLRDLTAELIEDNLDTKVSSVSIIPVSVEGVVVIPTPIVAEVENVAIEAIIKDNELIIGEVNEC